MPLDLTLLTVKDIARELGVSYASAKLINKQIKEEYKLAHKITKTHLAKYFGL